MTRVAAAVVAGAVVLAVGSAAPAQPAAPATPSVARVGVLRVGPGLSLPPSVLPSADRVIR